MAVSEKSLANLKPPFQAGNGVGLATRARPSNPITLLRLFTSDQDRPPFTIKKLRKLAEGNHPLRCMLAREVLCALDTRQRWAIDRQGKAYKAGTDPEPGKALERILDRLGGKPRQTLKIESEPARPVIDIKADIAALIMADPSITALVRAQLPAMEGPITSAASVDAGENDGGGTPQSDENAGRGAPPAQVLDPDSHRSDIIPEPTDD